MTFSTDAIIYWVVLDLRLVSYTFGFQSSQLRGVLGSRFVED